MDFFNDIFHNLALLEFYFLNIIYILLYIDFILSIFFQHSNILTRASHHWCLASNIVLVTQWSRDRESAICKRYFNAFLYEDCCVLPRNLWWSFPGIQLTVYQYDNLVPNRLQAMVQANADSGRRGMHRWYSGKPWCLQRNVGFIFFPRWANGLPTKK